MLFFYIIYQYLSLALSFVFFMYGTPERKSSLSLSYFRTFKMFVSLFFAAIWVSVIACLQCSSTVLGSTPGTEPRQ